MWAHSLLAERWSVHLIWWATSSLAERCPDKTEVEGSIPSSPTKSDGKFTIFKY